MHYLIDNYDSFTYNLYQLIGTQTSEQITVVKNDAIDVETLMKENPESIILSPGPGRPEDAGNMPAILKAFLGKVPIFGVCLGEQAIAQAYGAKIIHAPHLMHGKPSTMELQGNDPLFANCPQHFQAARYHSLVVDPESVPANLDVTAITDDNEIMAISNPTDLVYGVQFHPESIMTDPQVGQQIIQNFLNIVKANNKATSAI
ncbi:anthranilate synthase component II [Lentilactobacillus kefiri]|uniref:Glutamine amidotransferase of anthranilate synthase n=3 Tax=Bacilli TaxID=91061 RepID=A0A8E1V1M9_LENKE|nr:aminodeoxychorismate/anthranilate synthase component II [Lentilactobacillus kefiri]KRL73173.1 glutamine amidotransferase of anthranilate synthase [Lentilactobacillus parakefiri DSM 10551]MDF4143335.1 aminodeoxychorismate/anthranilate synthase component II [Lactobacillus kefiranofaciens]KRM53666.1 glutamine amidotransferase of anthranilate synthase [Lentilactobacillus kefiri DSM 20587 = JCM 5818]MCJ2161137.1 aminodeoxychorismate/anthranilate synthase component II [Lentilactobacillus kefiri]M